MQRQEDTWTAEEDASLRAMAAQGKSRMQIALRLRRTTGAIVHRAKMLKIALPLGKPGERPLLPR